MLFMTSITSFALAAQAALGFLVQAFLLCPHSVWVPSGRLEGTSYMLRSCKTYI